MEVCVFSVLERNDIGENKNALEVKITPIRA